MVPYKFLLFLISFFLCFYCFLCVNLNLTFQPQTNASSYVMNTSSEEIILSSTKAIKKLPKKRSTTTTTHMPIAEIPYDSTTVDPTSTTTTGTTSALILAVTQSNSSSTNSGPLGTSESGTFSTKNPNLQNAPVTSVITRITTQETNATTAPTTMAAGSEILKLVGEATLNRTLLSRLRPDVGSDRCDKKVVGYYTSWGEKVATVKMLSHLTHVMFAFPETSAEGSLWLTHEASVRLKHLISLRGKDVKPKISLSVGGWGKSEHFPAMARNESVFQRFTEDLLRIMRRYNLDGVDIDWEYPDDKELYVQFMRRLRTTLDSWNTKLKKVHFLLTFAGPAGAEVLKNGFDLKKLLEGDVIDWVNIMTYDFYGPWNSTYGVLTGPIAPLFYGAPQTHSRQLNVQWVIQQYMCKTKSPQKLVLGVPFYGRYWYHVSDPLEPGDSMWRRAQGDIGEGGFANYYDIQAKFLDNGFTENYSEKTKCSFAWNEQNRTYLGYESPKSVSAKAQYVIQNKLGGVMIWSVDADDDQLNMLTAVTNGNNICGYRNLTLEKVPFNCYEQRWWTAAESPEKAGMCGKAAPLINGYYPVCDPEAGGFSCCGQWGYCGGGPAYCDCPTCVDYAKHPELVKVDSVKPQVEKILWHLMASPDAGKCGYGAPQIDNTTAICNPDSTSSYCCSSAGFCGAGDAYCSCPDCVDFRKTPNFRFPVRTVAERRWWLWEDGADKSGKCGPEAPKWKDGQQPICDPFSPSAHCCSAYGYCGSGKDFCSCPTCVDYSRVA